MERVLEFLSKNRTFTTHLDEKQQQHSQNADHKFATCDLLPLPTVVSNDSSWTVAVTVFVPRNVNIAQDPLATVQSTAASFWIPNVVLALVDFVFGLHNNKRRALRFLNDPSFGRNAQSMIQAGIIGQSRPLSPSEIDWTRGGLGGKGWYRRSKTRPFVGGKAHQGCRLFCDNFAGAGKERDTQ